MSGKALSVCFIRLHSLVPGRCEGRGGEKDGKAEKQVGKEEGVRTVGAKKEEGEGLAEYSKTEHELSQEVTERKLLSHNRDNQGTGECGTSHGTVHVGMLLR